MGGARGAIILFSRTHGSAGPSRNRDPSTRAPLPRGDGPVSTWLVAHLDTTPTGEEDAPGFNGSWSNYPFFKSGTIVVSSIGEGVFLVQGPVRPAIP